MPANIKNGTQRLIAACVGFDHNGKGGVTYIRRNPNLAMIGGDSTGQQQYVDGAHLIKSSYNSIPVANAMAGSPMITVQNIAISGERSDQTLQRFRAIWTAAKLDPTHWWWIVGTVMLRTGTNDAGGAPYVDVNTGATISIANCAAQWATNLSEIIDTSISAGKQVITNTIWGTSSYGAPAIGILAKMNNLLGNIVARISTTADRDRFHVWEARPVRDPKLTTATALAYKTNYMRNESGFYTHEQTLGAYFNAKNGGLVAILKATMDALPRSYVDGAEQVTVNQREQLVLNPNLVITTGATGSQLGILGTGGTLGIGPDGNALTGIPDYWTVSRKSGDTTTTFTVNVKDDTTTGVRFVEVVDNVTVANGGITVQQTIPTANWSLGDIIQGFSTVEVVTGSTNLANACPYMEVNGTTATVNATTAAAGLYNDATHGVYPSTEGFVFQDCTEPVTVPTYDSKGYLAFYALHVRRAVAGTGTTRVSSPRLPVLPAALANNVYAGA